MIHGLPIVATPIAVEGMGLSDGIDCFVGTNPHQFTQRVIELIRDCKTADRISRNALRTVRNRFGVSNAFESLQEILRPVTELNSKQPLDCP